MATPEMYPVSNLFTMVTELLRELKLDDKYSVLDVKSFGYTPSNDDHYPPSIWIEVFQRSAAGNKIGTEVISRWIRHDVSYERWGTPPEEYKVQSEL